MKCMMCESYSLKHICNICQKNFLNPSLYRRRLDNGIEVLSFYKYSEIKELVHTKHSDLGFYIYTILAELSFTKFANEFHFDTKLASIPIDDNTQSGYSHTAILNKRLKSKNIRPLFNKLHAKNRVSYSGKSREFRLSNPREFRLKSFKEIELILVDDIITTGSTLTQAIELLHKKDKEVLLCLTLCDASLG